jgi:hypothetical protein
LKPRQTAQTLENMQTPDLVVGGLAAIIGLALIAGAIVNGSWILSLPKFRLLSESIGKTAARVVIALLGVAVIAISITIASGWRMTW